MVLIKRTNGEHGPVSSQSLANINLEDTIFFSCLAKRLDQTAIDLGDVFTRQSADQLIREHLKKNKVNVQIYCLNNRILFEKARSMVMRSGRKYVFYGDITNFYVFSSRPGVFMLCIHDSVKRKKTYESFVCDEHKDVDKLSKLISRAQLNPDCRLRRSWDIDGHFVSATDSSQEQPINLNGHNGITKQVSMERSIVITGPKLNNTNDKSSHTKPNQSNQQMSREIIVRNSTPILHERNDTIRAKQIEHEVTIPIKSSEISKHDEENQNLSNLFKNNLTFLSTLPSGKVEVCERGPVFMFSTRMPDRLEAYKGPIEVSGFN